MSAACSAIAPAAASALAPSKYYRRHVPDEVLLNDLSASVSGEREKTAEVLANIAEVERRKLFAEVGYSSMLAYCIGVLHMSEYGALKRVRAARKARRFPAIFAALEEGRLNLSAVIMIGRYLSSSTADELIAAATHKTKAQIEQLLAERFPKPDVPTVVRKIEAEIEDSENVMQLAPGPVTGHFVDPTPTPPPPRVAQLAAERFSLQLTMEKATHDKLRRIQELMGRHIPADVVLDKSFDLLLAQLEKRKLAATDRPRPARARTKETRHIPAHVKRTVRERDDDRCTFVGNTGHRCEERSGLEFDHVQEFARRGSATVDNIRLRCRTHNQFDAEQTFGVGFMENKRDEARRRAEERRASRDAERARKATEAEHERSRKAAEAERAREQDVVPWLRSLGYRADEARQAARQCEHISDAPLEERVRVALSFFRLRGTTQVASRPPIP